MSYNSLYAYIRLFATPYFTFFHALNGSLDLLDAEESSKAAGSAFRATSALLLQP